MRCQLAARDLFLDAKPGLIGQSKTDRVRVIGNTLSHVVTPQWLSASLMTPEQCAEFLGIKINTLYVMKSQGRIPYRKVGHLLRFDFDEIVEWTKDKEK